MKGVLVFDMDGVLVDVTESYREAIQQTVEHFTGTRISRELIQDYKNQGGWNDDWLLSTHIIREAGVPARYEAVVDYFQSIFHGSEGLILRERWLARDGLFERLAANFHLAVFTGRLRWEAELTLNRFAPAIRFAPIIGNAEVERVKPAPDGLLKIREAHPDSPMWYLGDTVDDARAARAAAVPFIGIASPKSLRREELVALLKAENALDVLEDLNAIEAALGG